MAMSELEWMTIFAGNLRTLMAEANMTLSDLAEESGLSKSTISRYLNKQRMPNAAALASLAHALPCAEINDLVYFYDRVETRI